jgi:hypothetical protein
MEAGIRRGLDAGSFSVAEVASVAGAHKAAAATLAGRGNTETLDRPLLSGALGGLGRVWLSPTLAVKAHPGTPWGNVAIDAVNIILGRHLKAAEKRLRPDQVDRIEIRTAFGPSATEVAAAQIAGPGAAAWSVAEAVALLVAHHEFGPEHLHSEASGEKTSDVRELVPRIAVIHDWRLSMREAVATCRALGPVLGEAGVRAVFSAARPLVSGRPRLADVMAAVEERSWEALPALQRKGGLEAVELASFGWCFPVEVKLYTTRGGWWPERRVTTLGNEASLAHKRGGAAQAGDPPASGPAHDWVQRILA